MSVTTALQQSGYNSGGGLIACDKRKALPEGLSTHAVLSSEYRYSNSDTFSIAFSGG